MIDILVDILSIVALVSFLMIFVIGIFKEVRQFLGIGEDDVWVMWLLVAVCLGASVLGGILLEF